MPIRESPHDIARDIIQRAPVEGREEISRYTDDVVNRAVDYAKSIAPVWPGEESQGRQPGTFRDSIYGEVYYGGEADTSHPVRANIGGEGGKGEPAGAIISDDPKAPFIEFGTAKTPEHGTFAKTAAHFNDLETHE